MKKSKACFLKKAYNVLIFDDVIVFVTSFAMLQVFKQYKCLYYELIIISIYINNFNEIIKLLYTDKI